MILAELEVFHSRPIAPTRRVALGRVQLPVSPAPGFGGILLAGVVAGHMAELDPELFDDLHRLTLQLQEGHRIPQPRLRHRFQTGSGRADPEHPPARGRGGGPRLRVRGEGRAGPAHPRRRLRGRADAPGRSGPGDGDDPHGDALGRPARPRVRRPHQRPRSVAWLVDARVPRSRAVGHRRARAERRRGSVDMPCGPTSSGGSATCSARPTPTTAATPTMPPSGSPSSPRPAGSCSPREPPSAAAGPTPSCSSRCRELVDATRAGGHRGRGRAAPGVAGRLPVPARGPARAGPAAEAARVRGRGGGPARRASARWPRADRARRPVDGRAHVLDGRRRRAAGRGPRADQLSAAPAGQARAAAHRAPARRSTCRACSSRGPGTRSARPPSSRRTPRSSRARSPTCGSRARATTSRVPTPSWPGPSGSGSVGDLDRRAER